MRLQIEILDVRARTTRTHRQAGAGAGRVTGKIGRDDGTKKRGGDGGRAPGESTILAGWKAGGAERTERTRWNFKCCIWHAGGLEVEGRRRSRTGREG